MPQNGDSSSSESYRVKKELVTTSPTTDSADQITDDGVEVDNDGFKKVYLENSDIPVFVRPHSTVTKALLQTKIKPVPQERRTCPKSYKNPWSLLTWGWVSPLLRTGFNRILEINDIFLISEEEKSDKRMKEYSYKLQFYKKEGQRVAYAEFWAILYTIRWPFIMAIFSAALYIAGEMGMSLMSRTLIELVSDIYEGRTQGHGHATAFAIGTTLVQMGFQVFFVWNGYRTRVLAETVRTILITAVYDKITKLSPAGRQLYPPNKITSIITTDTNRVFMAARWTSMLIIFLPAFGGMLGVLIYNIGVAALTGAGLVLLGIVVNIGISRVITGLRRKSLPFADARIGSVRETIENMRVIKFYGWESSFVDLVAKARTNETNYLKKLGVVEGVVDAILTSIPQFGGILSFAVRIIIGRTLPAALAFPSLTLFQLFVPLSMMFSQSITTHADAWASVKRLDDFFRAPEEPSYVITENVPVGSIQILDGAFKWDVDTPNKVANNREGKTSWFRKRSSKMRNQVASTVSPEYKNNTKAHTVQDDTNASGSMVRAGAKIFPGLKDINLDIKHKELIMVVGSIGSGKTTLLSSILGLISKTNGSVSVGGLTVSVLSMWSQNATIRNNILFGREYDEKRYNETVHACCLDSDFENLNGGDFAEVGERGITLSGGQKARIALARCVYAGGDIVLLDDVLSAVDGKVARHIFENCINGMLKNSTRLLVTHNLELLHAADRVIFMNGEGNARIDTLSTLLDEESRFRRMYYEATNQEAPTSNAEEAEPRIDGDHANSGTSNKNVAATDENLPLSKITRRENTKLIQEEKRFRGTVSFEILYVFLSSGAKIGILFVPVIILLQFAVATSQAMQSVFLQFWTSDKYHHPNGVYIGYYCLIVFLRAVFFVGVAVSICVFCFNSSSKLHNRAVENIYRAPMSYFDSTPLGRIINRFTDDTANLDTQMFMQLRMTLLSFSMLLASIVTVFVYIPWAILALVPILIVAFVLLNYYRASARELKRINSLFRSSMFTLITESISGMSVILSFKREKQYADDLNNRIDDMNSSFQINVASQYWLSLRVALATLSVTLIVVLLSVYQVFDLDSSKVGMLMSMLPSVSISVVILLPMLAELENQMNSVERLHELAYTLPQEAAFHIPENAPPADWPQNGAIRFENASLRYRPELPTVLKGLTLDIKAGEKIGICGRTGAGKSTILGALFRITELSDGKIFIDGIDTSTIGLRDLRTKMAIIPQEPVLFQGTIRSNLDPFNEHTDTDLWDALRRSGVIRTNEIQANGKVSSEHRFHLDTKTDSDGTNFSLGERQLLTLARALIRNAKIIVLDEATATVDFETDKMIQQTIARESKNCTILCIAHRLQTIVNYDRILIMDAGRIIEQGDPRDLFSNKSSTFAEMCKESGISEKDFFA